MPELILVDDDGRELFRGPVSQENVATMGRFIKRNMGALRGLAAVVAAWRQAKTSLAELVAKPAIARPRPNPRPPRRRKVRR